MVKEAKTMSKQVKKDTNQKLKPVRSNEARENQMINLAINLAEKQLMNGTATSQVITHYLKLGSTKEKIEKEILEKQKELLVAKTEALKSTQRLEELYSKAIDSLKTYSGTRDEEDEADYE